MKDSGTDSLIDKSLSLDSKPRPSQSPNDGFFIPQPPKLSPPISPTNRPLSPNMPRRSFTGKLPTTPYKSPT